MTINPSLVTSSLESSLQALANGGSTLMMDAFLDAMLHQVGRRERLVCTVVDESILRVEDQTAVLCEVSMNSAKAKLRTLSARLAVRCRQWANRDVSVYGDEVEFENPVSNQRCKVRFHNTPGEQRMEMKRVLVSPSQSESAMEAN